MGPNAILRLKPGLQITSERRARLFRGGDENHSRPKHHTLRPNLPRRLLTLTDPTNEEKVRGVANRRPNTPSSGYQTTFTGINMTPAESKETQAKQTKKRKSDTKPSDHNGGHGKKKKSRQKQLRDENAPKYPRSSYIHFLSARRADFEKEHADMEKIDINSAMAAEWRSLTDEQKKV
uniref:HMG box domain-containing protein n=1 Tax=Plectus sambesii TaxID=2011161 RepID=A0A914VRP2_9BILA